jgi:sterol 3beta-glucosyltransferase
MRFGIVAIGSRGDVQPYVALALGLQNRGNQATILAHENFKDFVEGYGLAFHSLTGSVEELVQSAEVRKVLKSGSFIAFTRYLQKNIDSTREIISQELLAGSEKVDVLVTGLLGMIWVACIAEKLGKKWAVLQVSLPNTPTRVFPLAALDGLDFPAYNLFTYRLFNFAYWHNNKKGIRRFREELGLSPLNHSLIRKIAEGKIPILYAFSPALLPRPEDWYPWVDITGFLYLDARGEIPQDLVGWIEKGEKPIYIGFGSIPIPDPELFSGILKELLDKTHHRFVFCKGWSPMPELPKHPNLFTLDSIDHQWLFPRCKAGVIHGGVGTMAAGLRAKIPLVILSIIADQPWWGKIIQRKNLGIHIPFKKLTKEKLFAALQKIQSPEIIQNSIEIGERIHLEGGLKRTLDLLEKYFN